MKKLFTMYRNSSENWWKENNMFAFISWYHQHETDGFSSRRHHGEEPAPGGEPSRSGLLEARHENTPLSSVSKNSGRNLRAE